MKPNIADIRKMLAAATPGPWYFFNARLYSHNVVTSSRDIASGQLVAKIQQERDGYLIAKAPETISALCDEVERLQEALEYALFHLDREQPYAAENVAREALRRDTQQ
jgi:hypothetical protein